jgi:hypothetical protein
MMLGSICKRFVVRSSRQPAFLRISSPGDIIRLHTYVCELVLVQAHKACLQRLARATRRPARRWYRHGAAGWAALEAGDGLALTTCLQKCALAHLAARFPIKGGLDPSKTNFDSRLNSMVSKS